MVNSTKTSIINRVNWIHKNRAEVELLNIKLEEVKKSISSIASETITVVDSLKEDMGNLVDINIEIDGRYYTLTQNSVGVEIVEFFINIQSK